MKRVYAIQTKVGNRPFDEGGVPTFSPNDERFSTTLSIGSALVLEPQNDDRTQPRGSFCPMVPAPDNAAQSPSGATERQSVFDEEQSVVSDQQNLTKPRKSSAPAPR